MLRVTLNLDGPLVDPPAMREAIAMALEPYGIAHITGIDIMTEAERLTQGYCVWEPVSDVKQLTLLGM